MEPNWTTISPFEHLVKCGGYEVSLTLLTHISSMEGGPQLILNLRKTCKAFKEWIDNIPSCMSDKVYSKISASITISRKSLHQFQKCKPPPFVFGLKLNNFEYFNQPGLNEEKSRFFKQFINYWAPRIRKLEITDRSAFLVEQVHQEFTKLEEIGLNSNCPSDCISLESLVFNLETFEYLKKLSLPLTWKSSLFREMTKLINSKSRDPNFELSIHWKQSGVRDRRWNSEYFQKFVFAINESSSSIQLLNISDDFLSELISKLDAIVYKQLLGRITWISLHSHTVQRLYSILDRNWFTNLNRVCCKHFSFRGITSQAKWEKRFAAIDIQLLEIALNNTILTRPPGSLTFTHLHVERFGPHRLHGLLLFVSEQCPTLDKLSLSMKCRYSISRQGLTLSQLKFLNLKYVNISIEYGFYDSAESTRAILFDIMKIHEIPLLTLKLSGSCITNGKLMIFDTQCINLLVNGAVSRTLIEFDLEGFTVLEEAETLLQSLKQRVQENRERRVARYGLEQKLESCEH